MQGLKNCQNYLQFTSHKTSVTENFLIFYTVYSDKPYSSMSDRHHPSHWRPLLFLETPTSEQRMYIWDQMNSICPRFFLSIYTFFNGRTYFFVRGKSSKMSRKINSQKPTFTLSSSLPLEKKRKGQSTKKMHFAKDEFWKVYFC